MVNLELFIQYYPPHFITKGIYLLVTEIDTRYMAFCPTPDHFDSYEDYEEDMLPIVESISDTIYIENKLALKGFNI